MFKIKKLSYILILFLVSCTGYEWNINYPDGPRLKFTYDLPNDKGDAENQLTKYVSSGELYIYKADELVQTRLLSQEEMSNPKGIILNLVDSEEYIAVCYANIGTHNTVNGISKLSTSVLNNKNTSSITSNDRVYYGTVVITPEQATATSKQEIILDLSTIHFKIKTIAKGFEGKSAAISISNISTGFNTITNSPISDNKMKMSPIITTGVGDVNYESNIILLKPSNVPHFNTDIEFKTNIDGESISFNLKNYITEKLTNADKILKNIVDRKKEVSFTILIDKNGDNITISIDIAIPDWEIDNGDIDVDDDV